MISELLINMLQGIVNGITSILPGTQIIPQGVYDAIQTIVNAYPAVNKFVPLDVLFACTLLVLGFEISLGLFDIGVWAFKKLTGH